MTVLSIAGFALGLNTMRDRGGVTLLTKVFWRFGTLVERVSETNYHLHSSFVLMASLVRATDDIRVRVVRLVLGLIPSRAYEKEISQVQNHSNRVMGYRVCQLILPITTYILNR